MRSLLSLLVFVAIANSANAGFFAKATVDKEGNCLPEVINEYAKLYGEIEAIDKVATRAEAQGKSKVKESQQLGLASFKELATKVKTARASIKKYGDTYGSASCKSMMGNKVAAFNPKESATKLDQLAVGYEKMAEDWLKPSLARK